MQHLVLIISVDNLKWNQRGTLARTMRSDTLPQCFCPGLGWKVPAVAWNPPIAGLGAPPRPPPASCVPPRLRGSGEGLCAHLALANGDEGNLE